MTTLLARLCCTTAVVSIILLSGCTSLSRQRDPLCSEIARFANSVDDDDVHSVELLTNWGGGESSDGQQVMGENGCSFHDQHADEARLCHYLGENTSIEFPILNFRRALNCLDKSESYLGPLEARVEYLNGLITSYSVPGVRAGTLVSIEFSTGSDAKLPSLKISAQRVNRNLKQPSHQ